ncbi:MAG: polysaccharide biosynthesis/export family protein, partial [Deltaproteobacteria bacterium]
MFRHIKRLLMGNGLLKERYQGAIRAALLAWACAMPAGCTMLETAAPSAPQSTPLSWLTHWVSQPIEMVPGFDVELIKPDPGPATVVADNLLEVTVWDLYEPGKPYTFPVRVSPRQTVEIPFLGEVAVDGRSIPEVETLLVEGFRKGDYLLNPRVLIRSLDPEILKVQVTGAVNRGGFVELTRTDPSVYAAILSAGGLKKTAGTQVAVTRRAAPVAAAQPEIRSAPPAEAAAGDAEAASAPDGAQAPSLRANSLDEVSVSPGPPAHRPAATNRALFSVVDTDDRGETRTGPPAAIPAGQEADTTVWYDVTQAHDCEQLKLLHLSNGDIVLVKATTPPLRIGGAVNRPGEYPLPPGQETVNVWDAIELAGGVRDATVPLQ